MTINSTLYFCNSSTLQQDSILKFALFFKDMKLKLTFGWISKSFLIYDITVDTLRL